MRTNAASANIEQRSNAWLQQMRVSISGSLPRVRAALDREASVFPLLVQTHLARNFHSNIPTKTHPHPHVHCESNTNR